MDIKELAENLYQHHEDYGQGITQNFFEVCLDCKKAADTLQELSSENKQLRANLIMQTALAQNGQSAIETNKQLTKRLNVAIEDMKRAIDGELICDFCKHDYKCPGEECDKYSEGVGCTDEDGNYYDWKWTCMDFSFGTCPKLEDTRCNVCFDNDMSGFEWRGVEHDRH